MAWAAFFQEAVSALPLSPVSWRQGPTPTSQKCRVSDLKLARFRALKLMPKTTIDGVGHKVDYAVKNDASISRDQIREWLVKDMRGVYLLLSELLNSSQCVDALTDIFYARYQDMHKIKSQGNDQ